MRVGRIMKLLAETYDKSFTYPVYRLTEESAQQRVANAWLAGYATCQAARKRRSTKNRSVKQ